MNAITTHTAEQLPEIKTFVREHQPSLSRNEWMALCDVLNGGVFKKGEFWDILWIEPVNRNPMLADSIEDSEPDGLYQKWEIDGPALVQKLYRLTEAETLAILHVVQIAWDDPEGIEEGLEAAGIQF